MKSCVSRIGVLRLAFLALAMIGLPALASAQTLRSSANALWQNIGVDTQMAYTDGAYANVSQVISDLHYLGICNVRDGITNGFNPWTGQWNGSAQIETYTSMALACVRFTFLFSSGGAMTPQYLNNQFALMLQVESAKSGSISGFETLNEFNNFDITWNGDSPATCAQETSDALHVQTYVFSMVRAIPSFNDTPVILATGFDAWDNALQCVTPAAPDVRHVRGLATWANAHPYPPEGAPPALSLNLATAVPGQTAQATFTEWGYSTSSTGWNGVSEDVQMRYGLDGLLDAASTNTRSFLFALLDAYAPNSPQGDQYFGLFDYTGAPKPLATAIHNMYAITHDAGNVANPLQYPDFTLSGLPTFGNAMALGRHDGAVMEAIWAEPALWDASAGTEYPIARETVTVSLGNQYSTVKLFDPTLGPQAIKTWANTSQVTVLLSASPIFLRAE